MDARLGPAKYAGLSRGDAHVIRNAGGRASDDAICSLGISYKLLGTREWLVVHHTDGCLELHRRGNPWPARRTAETAALGPDGFYELGRGPGGRRRAITSAG
jgi:carbonic anhydrase